MIGTYEGARKALEGDLPHLDSGTSRHVYRDGNLVYKIDIGWDESNLAEWDTYQKILDGIAVELKTDSQSRLDI